MKTLKIYSQNKPQSVLYKNKLSSETVTLDYVHEENQLTVNISDVLFNNLMNKEGIIIDDKQKIIFEYKEVNDEL